MDGGKKLQLYKKVDEERFENIENQLEKLSIQIITILKECKEKGVIEESEYEEHTKCKEDFLTYLDNKRKEADAAE